MNSMERVRRRWQGETVDRGPNFDIFMTYAAHFIGQPLRSYYLDHRVLVSANLAVREAFDIDLLQAISDPYRETHDLGAGIEFPEDGLPLCRQPLLAGGIELARLRRLAPGGGKRMGDRLEAIRLFKEKAGGEVPVMGWVEGALAQAADLRGVSQLLTDLVDQPEQLEELLERCVEVEIEFARAQVAAGADLIGLGDAVASQISPRMYRQYALPYEQRIFSAVHALGAQTRLHICGNTSRFLADMAQSGAEMIDVDWMVDYGKAAAIFSEKGIAICGNFDPVSVMLQGTPEDVYQATRACLQAGGARSFSAAGCEIPDGTPVENLLAQQKAIREF
jgi:uroporphyrinogen-III decarboxylase